MFSACVLAVSRPSYPQIRFSRHHSHFSSSSQLALVTTASPVTRNTKQSHAGPYLRSLSNTQKSSSLRLLIPAPPRSPLLTVLQCSLTGRFCATKRLAHPNLCDQGVVETPRSEVGPCLPTFHYHQLLHDQGAACRQSQKWGILSLTSFQRLFSRGRVCTTQFTRPPNLSTEVLRATRVRSGVLFTHLSRQFHLVPHTSTRSKR